MPSFERRIADNGTITHRAKVRLKGYPQETASFDRLTDAKRWAQATEAAMREGRYFKTSEAKKHTLADMVDRYIRDVLPSKPKNAKNTERNLLWWKSKIGAYSLADITPSLIVQHRDALLNSNTGRGTKRSPSTVIRYLAALSHAFTIAMKEWGWVDDTPIRKVTKPTAPRGRVRFLDDDERQKLLDVCKKSKSKHLYAIVVLAISTGMRHGEIINLRWNQVDIKNCKITLHDTKNGDRRSVPLFSFALEQITNLSKIRRIDTDLLFPSHSTKKPVDTRKPWYTALSKANIEDFRFHDLRHCTASYLAMNGATLVEIAAVLGHKTLSMVKRYSHISDNHTSDVVARMNNKIFSSTYDSNTVEQA